MASWLILLIKQFVDIANYLIIGNALFDIQIKNKKIKVLSLTLIIIIIYISCYNIILDIWLNMNAMVCIIFLLIIYGDEFFKTIKIIVMDILITTLVEQFIDIFISYGAKDIVSINFVVNNICRFILVIIIAVIIKLTKIIKSKKSEFTDIAWYIYMNIFFCFSATLFPLYIVILNKDVLNMRLSLLTITIAYINIIISVISIILYIKNMKDKEKYYLDNKLKDKTLILQEDYYQKLINNYSNIRQFKHDLKGHLNVINRLVTNNNYTQATEYISEISKSISKNDVYKTNNIYISTILNSFDQVFKDENIKFEISYYITNHIIMESMDICSLFYNLVSNAIESNLKITDERYIKLYIAEIKNNIVIKLVNPVDENFNLNIIKENKTTKQDKENHGFGLITINNIVSKYRGSIDYSMMDTDLIIDIVLFNTLKTQD